MEFDEQQNGVPGKFPDYGAIFMSNRATKKECFRRKLLGLPLGQAAFVKQVKAGMILFLFEFERRELHGVFQACSDGAMNIVPHAYASSGKQFPAQVQFTRIWHCSPLSENEFHGAIRENYFAPKKFNFGLSEKQVKKLLLLFSSRKLTDRPLQRERTQSKVAGTIGYSRHKPRSAVDVESFIPIDSGKYEQDAYGSFGSVISGEYPGTSIGSHGRLSDDQRFASAIVGNVHKADSEFGLPISNELFGDSLSNIRRPIAYGPGNQHNDGLFESNLPMCCSKPILESNSLVNDPVRQSVGGKTVTSTIPYDPDVPSLNYWFSPSHAISNSMPECTPCRNCIFPSFVNQSFPSYVEPMETSKCPNIDSALANNGPLYSPNRYEYSHRTGMLFPGAEYSENEARMSLGSEGFRSLSFSTPSSAPIVFPEGGNNRRTNEGASSCLFSPYKAPPFAFDSSYPFGAKERYDHEMPWCENDEAFASNIPILRGGKTRCIEHQETTSPNPDIHGNNRGMYSDYQKERKSVFRRLSLIPEVCEQNNGSHAANDECDVDSTADEVMAMLHQSHYQWIRARRSKLLIKRFDHDEDSGDRKQLTSNSKFSKDHLAKISKKMNISGTAAVDENCVQRAEGIHFVDFKRRGKVWKTLDDANTGDCNEAADSGGTSGRHHKRRKLIRPKFNGNESLNNESKISQNVALPHVMLHSGEKDENVNSERDSSHGGEEKAESCVSSFGNKDNDGKEPSHNTDKDESHNPEEALSLKNSVIDGLLQLCNDDSCSNLLESFPKLCGENSETGMAHGGPDHGGNEKSIQNVKIVDKSCTTSVETAIGSMMSSSINHNSESEKVSEESGDVEGKKLPSSLESVTIQCKAGFETISCGKTQESSQDMSEGIDQCGELRAMAAGREWKLGFKQDFGD